MLFGFITHLIGFFCDSSMAIRVVSTNRIFNLAALVACGLYTIAFIIWLIWIMVVRWSASGKLCSGEYLDNVSTPLQGYAIIQG